MKNKNKIINELYENSPDVREKIKKDVAFSQFKKEKTPAEKSLRSFKWATAMLSVALIAMMAVLGPIIARLQKKGGQKAEASAYVMHIDVNPSVRFEVSGDDVVTAQQGMNEDGVVFLYKEDFVGKNIDDATKTVLQKMSEAGLVNGEVKISITDKKTGKPIKSKQDHAVQIVQNLFAGKISALILSDEDIDAIEDYYKDRNIGKYEQQMIKEFKKNLIEAIKEKIRRIEELKTLFDGLDKNRRVKDLDNDAEKSLYEKIQLYCDDYKLNWNEVRKDKIKEFYKDIKEKGEELEDCIEDIENSDSDDYGDELSDLLEIVKEDLFEKED